MKQETIEKEHAVNNPSRTEKRTTPKIKIFNPTDLGNAERLVSRHGNVLRYCHAWKRWLIWDGRKWCVDSKDMVFHYAKLTVKNIYLEAASSCDESERKYLARWAVKSEDERRLKSMISLSQKDASVSIEPNILDADAMLLNWLNETIDLRTGKLRPHSPNDLIAKIIPVEYGSDAKCPTWINFLNTIFEGNQELIHYLQAILGYSLTGVTSEQCLFLCYGTGANGKSTLLKTVQDVLGSYAQTADFETFLDKKYGSGVRNDIARMRGKMFVAAVETGDGRRLAESLVKQVTGSDVISARFLYGEFFEFEPTFKIWLAANHKPKIYETNNGIWRRIKLIPFSVTIPEDKRDKQLCNKLNQELPGILRWFVKGCLEWQEHGLKAPEDVINATNDYKAEMDDIGGFLGDCCTLALLQK